MKKSLFILASAALVLASCNNDVQIAENVGLADGNAQKEIAFSLYSQKPNRVKGNVPVMGTAFPTDSTMQVKAYQSAPKAGEYFAQCTFAKNGTHWKATPTAQYWPLSAATINFFAVTGANANHITIANAFNNAEVAYTAVNSYSQLTQSDIMYAFGRGSVSQSGNTLTFPDKVDMVFEHALALVAFEVKGNGDPEVAKIKVDSIKLIDATYNGTLTLTPSAAAVASTGDVTTDVSWVAGSAVDTVKVPGISTQTALAAGYRSIGNGLMIIPGTGFKSFIIYYTLNNNSYKYEYTIPTTPSTFSAVAAYKYTYRINFKLHEIEINPSVTSWSTNEHNEDITIQN